VPLTSRPMRDRRAVARYAGLTGAPNESGAERREQGLARAGNARVRRGMIQLAWLLRARRSIRVTVTTTPGASRSALLTIDVSAAAPLDWRGAKKIVETVEFCFADSLTRLLYLSI
jgi:transposase